MMSIRRLLSPALIAALACTVAASGGEVRVHDAASLRAAVAAAAPGTRILLAPGDYGGGFYFPNLRGEPDRPIILAAADPARPPVFSGADVGLHLSNPAHVELRNLVITGMAHNGLNLDDTGGPGGEAGAHHVVLDGLAVSDIGGAGNHDGIKASGLWDLAVRASIIERPGRWVARILQETRDADFVPCRGGAFTDNLIVYEGTRTAATLVNVGAGTAAETFIFARNAWLNVDAPERSRPVLPVAEAGGHYGLDREQAANLAGATAPARGD